MARLTVLAPLPPSRSSAAPAGAALVRLLRRSRPRHRVRALWPVPEHLEIVLAGTDLPVYLVSPDPEDSDVYRAATTHPGLVVLVGLDLEAVVRDLIRARDPAGRAAVREAEAADGAWFAHVARRARGLVVLSEADRARLLQSGCRTPTFVAALDDRGARAVRRAVASTLALINDPAERTLGRWASALRDSGVGPEELVEEGYGLRYGEALDEIRRSPAGST
jgi:hypothetical protein